MHKLKLDKDLQLKKFNRNLIIIWKNNYFHTSNSEVFATIWQNSDAYIFYSTSSLFYGNMPVYNLFIRIIY